MADNVDIAADTAQLLTDLAIHQHRRDYALPPRKWADGAVICRDCDDAIADARLSALPGCVRCIDCQSAHELRARQ